MTTKISDKPTGLFPTICCPKRKAIKTYTLLLPLICLLAACQDDPLNDMAFKYQYLPDAQRMNRFTEEKMKDIYLWADEVRNRKADLSLNPSSFFYQLRYKDDPWSSFESEYDGTALNTNGYDNKFGYYLRFYLYNNYNIIAKVCYVYPNTPAAKAGLKRGDLIWRNDGVQLNDLNYEDLYYNNNISIELARLDGHKLVPVKGTLGLTLRKTPIDPVLVSKVVVCGDKKIGYLHYTEFVYKDETNLERLTGSIREMKQAGIDAFVLDLRYNSGGYLKTARHLCSLLAPADNVKAKDVIVSKHWNNRYREKYRNDLANRFEYFDNGVLDANLDLKEMYVIVSEKTASASEFVISALQPYLDKVTLIGTRTHGKYAASVTLQPNDKKMPDWAIHPIVFTYRNVREQSVKGGLTPEVSIEEAMEDSTALGDPEEQLFQEAINLICGTPTASVAQKTGAAGTPFRQIQSAYPLKNARLVCDAPIEL